MYVKQYMANRLFESASEKFAEKGIGQYTDVRLIDGFQEQLRVMANARNYKEGERIMPSDLGELAETVKAILSDMSKGIVEGRLTSEQKENIEKGGKPEENGVLTPIELGSYDPYSSIMAVTDYLFAMATKTLGSPDIPDSFGKEVTNYIDKLAPAVELKLKETEFSKYTVDKRFDAQRRKDALVVRRGNKNLRDAIIGKQASPLKIAQYSAEYFALKKRQEAHTDIWRFFHKKENQERMKLLADMKNVLEKALGKDVDIDTLKPSKLAAKIAVLSAKDKFAPNTFARRNKIAAESIGTEPTLTDRADNDKEKPFEGVVSDEKAIEKVRFDKDAFNDYEVVVNNFIVEKDKVADLSDREIEETDLSVKDVKI